MNYWDNITKIYEKQRAKGLAEYGQTLEQNTKLTFVERMRMDQEEMIDHLVYTEHAIQAESPCVDCQFNGTIDCRCGFRIKKMNEMGYNPYQE